jgi:hypothetical protein
LPLPKTIDLLRAGMSGSNVFSSQATTNQTSTPTLSTEIPSVASRVDEYIRRLGTPGETLRWPVDLPPSHLIVDLHDFQSISGLGTDSISFDGYHAGNRRARIRIPIPTSPPSDSFGISWSTESFFDFFRSTNNYASGGPAKRREAFRNLIRGAESARNGLELTLGGIINPAMAVMFKGPMYKEYSLGLIMAPRTEDESVTIRRIVNWFRWGTATEANFGGAVYEYPSVFKLQYSENITEYGEVGPGINPLTRRWLTYSKWQAFKPAVMTSMNVNYIPGGHPILLENGYPEAIQIALHFTEIEYWLKRDFEHGPFSVGSSTS